MKLERERQPVSGLIKLIIPLVLIACTPSLVNTQSPNAQLPSPSPSVKAKPVPVQSIPSTTSENPKPSISSPSVPEESPSAEDSDCSVIDTNSFNGRVYDTEHKLLNDATVTVTSDHKCFSNLKESTNTIGGTYAFNGFPVGYPLKITASKEGYSTKVREVIIESGKSGIPCNKFDFGSDKDIEDFKNSTGCKIHAPEFALENLETKVLFIGVVKGRILYKDSMNPVRNKPVYIKQPSSTATGITDDNGYYKIDLIGTNRFLEVGSRYIKQVPFILTNDASEVEIDLKVDCEYALNRFIHYNHVISNAGRVVNTKGEKVEGTTVKISFIPKAPVEDYPCPVGETITKEFKTIDGLYSFGNIPTNVPMNYEVLDENGNILHKETTYPYRNLFNRADLVIPDPEPTHSSTPSPSPSQ